MNFYKLIVKWVDSTHRIIKSDEYGRDSEEKLRDILARLIKENEEGYEIWWTIDKIDHVAHGKIRKEDEECLTKEN